MAAMKEVSNIKCCRKNEAKGKITSNHNKLHLDVMFLANVANYSM